VLVVVVVVVVVVYFVIDIDVRKYTRVIITFKELLYIVLNILPNHVFCYY
jgi:hypothetical protein